MGFLLNPYDFSLRSSNKTSRHRQVFSYRLLSITFFAVAFALPLYAVVSAAAVDQTDQQEIDSQSSSTLNCETRALDDVPPDPVSTAVHAFQW